MMLNLTVPDRARILLTPEDTARFRQAAQELGVTLDELLARVVGEWLAMRRKAS